MAGPWEQYAAPRRQYQGQGIEPDSSSRSLPKGIVPSATGAGRGRINPPLSLAPVVPERAPQSQPATGMPSADIFGASDGANDGAAIMAAAQPERSSVLEGRQMPEPKFDAAWAERMSNRKFAEQSDLSRIRPGTPSASPITAKTIPISNKGILGRAGDLVGAQMDEYAAGLGYKNVFTIYPGSRSSLAGMRW